MPPLRFNVPPLTRTLVAALICLSTLNAALRYRYWTVVSGTANPKWPDTALATGYLHLVPPVSIVYPWTFVTSSFVEQNLVVLAVAVVVLFYGGRYLERAWSSAEFAKFILFVTTIPNVLTFLFISLLAASGVYEQISISGNACIAASFLVSFKQLVPEHTVSLFRSLIRIRVKHFPALFLVFHTILLFVPPFTFLPSASLAYTGFFTSWIYLRFYRISPALGTSAGDESSGSGSIKGDASDTFAFAHFFPEPIHTPLSSVCDAIYNTGVAIRVVTPFSAADVEAGNEQAHARAEGGLPSLMNPSGSRGGGAGVGSSRAEAERRRALALKALDQRLHSAQRVPIGGAAALAPTGPTVVTPAPAAAAPDLGKTDLADGDADGAAKIGQD